MNLTFSDVLAVGGYALALVILVVSIIVARHYARRGREKPIMKWAVDDAQVLAPDDWLFSDGLRLDYRGTELQTLSRSHVALWLHAGDTVRGADVADLDPLRVEFGPEDRILAQRIVTRSRAATDVRISAHSGANPATSISFDFLDPGDGVVIEWLHEKSGPPRIAGAIRGATIRRSGGAMLDGASRESVRRSLLARYRSRRTKRGLAFDIVNLGLAGLTLAAALLLVSRLPAAKVPEPLQLGAFAFFVYPIFLAFFAALRFRQATHAVVPRTVVAEELALAGRVVERRRMESSAEIPIGALVRHRRYGNGQVVGHYLSGDVAWADFVPEGASKAIRVRRSHIELLEASD